MTRNNPILVCVPNVSYAKKDSILDLFIQTIQNVPGQHLLDVDTNQSANRTVFTFAGEAGAVITAAFELYKVAAKHIDMRQHKGVHPRIGAVDVCPIIPLKNCIRPKPGSRVEALYWTDILAKRVGQELHIPVFSYEYSAKSHRKTLPAIRKGEYEGLFSKLSLPSWQPNYGGNPFSERVIEKSGATIIGVRNILIACNISLNTKDKKIAQKIAGAIRTIGTSHRPYSIENLRAIGWYIEEFNHAQVSINLLNYKKTSLLEVWNSVKERAESFNCEVIGCEIIGLIPEQSILEASAYAISQDSNQSKLLSLEERINIGIAYLGLDKIKPFNPEKKILEYTLRKNNVYKISK